ncbi:hypothetical protein D3C86_2013680 [compost metagenome]
MVSLARKDRNFSPAKSLAVTGRFFLARRWSGWVMHTPTLSFTTSYSILVLLKISDAMPTSA